MKTLKTLIAILTLSAVLATSTEAKVFESPKGNTARTAEIIQHLRSTAPEILQAIDSLDLPIYFEVVPESQMRNVSNDGTTEWRAGYLIIRIKAELSMVRAIKVAVHEIGHTWYQAIHPEYAAYYAEKYSDPNATEIGHAKGDPSHEATERFLQIYLKAIKNKRNA